MSDHTRFAILDVDGPLRTPVRTTLRQRLAALLARGERRILVNLARVSDIDAAGVGELVRAFNMANAAGGVLRIQHATTRVRQLLEAAGLARLLSHGS